MEGTVENLEIDEPIKEPNQDTNGASGNAAVQLNLVQNQTAPTVAEGTTLATTALGTQNPRMESNLTHQQLLLMNLFDGFSMIQPTMETVLLPKGLKTINSKEILKLVKDYLRRVQKPAIQSIPNNFKVPSSTTKGSAVQRNSSVGPAKHNAATLSKTSSFSPIGTKTTSKIKTISRSNKQVSGSPVAPRLSA